jgi:hypothetical protein
LITPISIVQQNYVSNIRGKLKRNGGLTELEISKGIEIIDLLKNKNIEFDSIIKLSKLEERDLIDPIVIYNRLKLVENDTWKKVIALGEQTGKLSFKEISIIKTVMTRLKKQENIDLRRLQIVNDALDKVKKFGIKV